MGWERREWVGAGIKGLRRGCIFQTCIAVARLGQAVNVQVTLTSLKK